MNLLECFTTFCLFAAGNSVNILLKKCLNFEIQKYHVHKCTRSLWWERLVKKVGFERRVKREGGKEGRNDDGVRELAGVKCGQCEGD